MTLLGRRALLAIAPALFGLAAAPAAQADEQVVAESFNRYRTPAVTIDQGELLTFQNLDVTEHNVTARQRDGQGQPLFASATIGGNREAEVEGARSLVTGDYGFFCTVHPDMTGTLTVTSAGTPLPRPDRSAPELRLAVGRTTLGRLARSGRLRVSVSLDESARVAFSANAKIGSRVVAIIRPRTIAFERGSARVSFRLTRAARRALGRARRAAVTVLGRAVDASGNTSLARGRRTFTR